MAPVWRPTLELRGRHRLAGNYPPERRVGRHRRVTFRTAQMAKAAALHAADATDAAVRM